MKKLHYSIFTFLTLAMLGANAQQSLLFTKKLHTQTVKQNGNHAAFFKTDTKFLPQLTLEYSWSEDMDNWDTASNSITSAYNSKGLLTSEQRKWSGSPNSGPDYKTEYFYNSTNKQLSQYSYSWNFSTSQWDSTSKTLYGYDANGSQISNEQYYNNMSTGWELSYGYKTSYTYNSSNIPIQEISQEWDNQMSAYQNTQKSLYAYDAQGVLNNVEQLFWDTTTSDFVKTSRIHDIVWQKYFPNDLDASMPTSFIIDEWNGSNYVESAKGSSKYDAHDNEIETREEKFDGANWVLTYITKTLLTYNTDGAITVKIEQGTQDGDTILVNYGKKVYSNFLQYTGLFDTKQNQTSINIFPNPVKDISIVNTNTLSNQLKFVLYDMLGNEVLNTTSISGKFTIEKTNQHAGIYIYRVFDNQQIISVGKLAIN